MRNYLILFTFLVSPFAMSTTFVPLTIKQQITESHGVVKGEVSSIVAVEGNNGEILTKVEIFSDKWIGIEANNNRMELYYPGGQIGEQVQLVQGAPKFEMGESVVLLIKKVDGKNWVQNLGLGKFSIKRVGSNHILVNQIFPQLVNVGQIPLKKFLTLTERLKKKKFSERFKDKYELSKEKQAKIHMYKKKRSRAIASIEAEQSEDSTERVATYWLVIILGIMGLVFGVKRKKSQ